MSQQDLYQSGSRIKAKMLVSADGAKSFETWFDTQLQIDCVPAKTYDGQVRCIPTASASGLYWADSSCTVPLYTGYCATPPPTHAYAQIISGSGCSSSYGLHAYSVGSAFGGQVFYGAGGPGACTATTLTMGTIAYSMAEIDPSQFVAWTEDLE